MKNKNIFESEPSFVRNLWVRALAGKADESVYDGSNLIYGFELTPELSEETGYIADGSQYVCLWQNDEGYVSHLVMSYNDLCACEGFVDEVTQEYYHDYDHFDDDYMDMGGEA